MRTSKRRPTIAEPRQAAPRKGAAFLPASAPAGLAQLRQFVVGLPHGYDAVLGKRCLQLTGAQQQRVAIAPMVACDCPPAPAPIPKPGSRFTSTRIWTVFESLIVEHIETTHGHVLTVRAVPICTEVELALVIGNSMQVGARTYHLAGDRPGHPTPIVDPLPRFVGMNHSSARARWSSTPLT